MGMVPLGISALRELVPPQKLGSSIALISATLGIGGALGLPISAAVTQNTSWRVLFWGCAVLSVLIGVLIWRLVPATPAMATGGFDFVGAVGLGIGLVSLLLAVSKGAVWGWGSPEILGLFAVAVVVLLAWGWWELRTADPLVNLRLAAGRQVLLTNAASVVVGFSMYAQSLIIPQLLQLPESPVTGWASRCSPWACGCCRWFRDDGRLARGRQVVGGARPEGHAGARCAGHRPRLRLVDAPAGLDVGPARRGLHLERRCRPGLRLHARTDHERGAAVGHGLREQLQTR